MKSKRALAAAVKKYTKILSLCCAVLAATFGKMACDQTATAQCMIGGAM